MSDRLRDARAKASDSLRAAMLSLESSNVQIVLVVDDGDRLVGTLTDGDIRRALLAGASLSSEIGQHMSREFTSVGPEATRAEVVELMQARLIRHVPIVGEDGRLGGLHLLHEMLGPVELPNWAVVMAGGKGTRLWPLTANTPKPMLMVAGRPILERIVLNLVGFGIRRVFLSVNYLSELIEKHFGDGSRLGCRIEYLRETRPLGTGGALSLLPERPTAPLLVLNGDLVVQFDVARLLAFHTHHAHRATVGVHDYTHTVPLGVVDTIDGRVVELREKPTMVWQTNAGIYALQPDLLDLVPPETEFPMPALVEQCLQRGESVGAFHIEGDWIDVGRTQELRRARGEHEQ